MDMNDPTHGEAIELPMIVCPDPYDHDSFTAGMAYGKMLAMMPLVRAHLGMSQAVVIPKVLVGQVDLAAMAFGVDLEIYSADSHPGMRLAYVSTKQAHGFTEQVGGLEPDDQ